MSKHTLFVLAVATVALCGCAGGNNNDNASSGSQRSVNADIAAAQDTGPTLDNQDTDQVSVLPTVSVPFKSAY
jgi:hypothetical protein